MMSESGRKIVIIGGGIIGCCIADEVAAYGHKVQVIERGELCGEASWAAAGMLAPNAEMAHAVSQPLHRLMLESHTLYPDFLKELAAETGIDVGFQHNGSLMLATDFEESKILAGIFEQALSNGKRVEELNASQIRRRLPEVSERVETGLLFPEDSHLDARALGRAIVARSRKRAVCFNTGVEISGLKFQGAEVSSLITPEGEIQADLYILTAGAWSAGILKSAGLLLPVRPIRGQIIELETVSWSIPHLVHSSRCYMVPRPGGRTLIGATMENVGYDKRVTAGGVQHLVDAATRVFPALKDATLTRVWAGLRPDTRDNLPILGRTSIPNLIIATGHFRNGILLAPVTAKLIAELVNERPPSYAMEAFNPHRFLSSKDNLSE